MYSQTILYIQIKNLNAESVQGHHSLSVSLPQVCWERYINENALDLKKIEHR